MNEQLFNAFLVFLLGYLLTVYIFRTLIYRYIFRHKRGKTNYRNLIKGKSYIEKFLFINLKNTLPIWLFYGNIIYSLLLPLFLIIFLGSLFVKPFILIVLYFARIKSAIDLLVVIAFTINYIYNKLTKIEH